MALPSAAPAQTPEGGRTSLVKPWDSFFSVACLPSGKCYVVGTEGALLTSTDGGQNWERRAIAERGDLSWFDLYSIRFANDGQTGWIGGESGLILKTTDGGQTWSPQTSGTTENIFRIAVVDARTAYACGTNGLLMGTTDGGAHWQLQTLKSGLIFLDIAFADPQNGWTVGEFETIMHTADGGKTWTPQIGGKRANFKLPALFAIRFSDAQHGWAAGQGGTLLRTDNGGATWQPVTAPSASPMYSVVYVGGDVKLPRRRSCGAQAKAARYCASDLPAAPHPPCRRRRCSIWPTSRLTDKTESRSGLAAQSCTPPTAARIGKW